MPEEEPAGSLNIRWLLVGFAVLALFAFVLSPPQGLRDVAVEKLYKDKISTKAAAEELFGKGAEFTAQREIEAQAVLRGITSQQLREFAEKLEKEEEGINTLIRASGITADYNVERLKKAAENLEKIEPAKLARAREMGIRAGEELSYAQLSEKERAATDKLAKQAWIVIGMMLMAVIFFTTEALPLPTVAGLILIIEVASGAFSFKEAPKTFIDNAVFFIMGVLMISAGLIKLGVDKRIGMFIFTLFGASINRVVLGIVIATALLAGFISEHAAAAMFLAIGVSIYKLITRDGKPAPQLGKLLMFAVAQGCVIGGPATPSGGARNAIMIGFLSKYGVNIGYAEWMSYAFVYTLLMIPVVAFLLPRIFKSEITDLSPAINVLRQDLEKMGKMTGQQWLGLGIFIAVVVLWITDKSLVRGILGHELGIGTISIAGAVAFLLAGLMRWKDVQKGTDWGVVVLYAGAISMGTVLDRTGAAYWIARSVLGVVSPLGLGEGLPLAGMVMIIAATMTNFMSDGATVAVLGPIVLTMAELAKTSPVMVGLATSIGASFAFWLVVGTPANAIAYGSGLITGKDFLKAGIVVWIIAQLVMVAVMTVWWSMVGFPV